MVLIYYGTSEHDAHGWSKKELYTNKNGFDAYFEVIIALNKSKYLIWYFSKFKSALKPYPFSHETDPRILSRIKMKQIRNTVINVHWLFLHQPLSAGEEEETGVARLGRVERVQPSRLQTRTGILHKNVGSLLNSYLMCVCVCARECV